MSDHVTEWLNAYFDGELTGKRLQQVEDHLAACSVCQAELNSLQSLSGLLHAVPEPEFISPERLATQVNLLLPHKRIAPPKRQLFESGGWLIPVGILTAWLFINTTVGLSDLLNAAKGFGLLDNTTSAWIAGPANTDNITSTLGQFGMLHGSHLQWAEAAESFTRNLWLPFVLQAAVALLYLTWFAVWWARRTQPRQEQLLEN